MNTNNLTQIIPKDWAVSQIRYYVRVLTDFTANGSFASLAENVKYLDEGYSRLVRLTDLRVHFENKGIYITEEAHEYLSKSELFGGEILLANVGAYAGLAWQMPEIDFPASLGPNMFLIKFTEKIDNRFAYYVIISRYFHEQLSIKAQSAAQPKLNKDDFRSCVIARPSLSEQILIARFLDQKTSQIDQLIGQKEKLLKLLIEKRTAIITQAVTKGLDPTVEMKDSGIDWLGEIPKDWEIKPLKFVVSLINEKFDELGDLTYLGLEHIESWTSKRIMDEEAKSEGAVTRFQPNDVLFGKLRPYLAKVYLADFEGGVSTEALVLRSNNEVLPAFLKYYLVSDLLIDVINSSTYGSKMPRASWNFIGRLPMILPTIEVQNDISEFLTTNIGKFDISISKIKKSINQLKEYRDALISSAVTGQIDVRREVGNG